LNDSNINTVAILTRHGQHAGLLIKALQSGKHVFVEKPLAVTAEQLDSVSQALIVNSQKLITVGFNRRFAPLARRLQEFLVARSEPLYMHYRVNAGYIPLNHWTHDPVQGVGGLLAKAVTSWIYWRASPGPRRFRSPPLPCRIMAGLTKDNVSMTFTFPDGSIGVVDYLANGDKSFPKERLEVFCGGRIAVLDDFRTLEMLHAGRRSVRKQAQDKGWKDEWIAFTNAIRTGGQPPIPYEQLIGVTKATFAAMQALHEGQKIDIV